MKIDFKTALKGITEKLPWLLIAFDEKIIDEKLKDKFEKNKIKNEVYNILKDNPSGISRKKVLLDLKKKELLKSYNSFKHHIRRFEEENEWIEKFKPEDKRTASGKKLKEAWWKLDDSRLDLIRKQVEVNIKKSFLSELMKIPDLNEDDCYKIISSLKK